ncbi:hypothetical protein PEBR_21290 [Penicillium brasilianum]|uniref:Uncharacterized protein n=1 Tax=Penicillium brasilianum TaxID=104259 RepID=A0A1S9RM99_PENBI|nr:hypothetical protein PEBR_21290 [Penicillium brasilianum]
MVDASKYDTHLVLRRLTNTSRFFKNKVSSEALRVEKTSKTGRTYQSSVADRYCSAETNISSLGPPVKPWALYDIPTGIDVSNIFQNMDLGVEGQDRMNPDAISGAVDGTGVGEDDPRNLDQMLGKAAAAAAAAGMDGGVG